MKLKNNIQRASHLANDLNGLDNKIKENLDKIGRKEGLALLREWIETQIIHSYAKQH